MMIVRNNKWDFIGECWGRLVFQNKQFSDERVFVTEAKYVDVKNNNTYHLRATEPTDDIKDIPYQKKHFSACVVRKNDTK